MSNRPFLKSLFVISLMFLSTNVFAATFNVSNTPQLRQALLDAALNGQNDTVVLAPGVYKTTSDGLGSFRFSDAEAFNLTIMAQPGLNRDDVILDGDGTDAVMSLLNSANSRLLLRTLTIRNAVGDEGDILSAFLGFYDIYGMDTNFAFVTIYDVVFTHNLLGLGANSVRLDFIDSDINGGFLGIRADVSQLVLQDSLIQNNHGSGGVDVYLGTSDIVEDTFVIIDRTSITGNRADEAWGVGAGEGAGVQIDGTTTSIHVGLKLITNSLFESNIAADGAAIWYPKVSNFIAVNNTIVDNDASGRGGSVNVIGGLFINNIFSNEKDVSDNNTSGTFYNNYIDYLKLDPSVLLKDNILPSAGNLDFIDEEFRIGENSVVIDKGLNPNSTSFANLVNNGTAPTINDTLTLELLEEVLLRDKDIRPRVIGLEIDMGAYEYGSPASYPPIDLGGTVKAADGTRICAMVLASGQYMFSCNPSIIGSFGLTDLPTEIDGTVKRQVYADGFFPKVDIMMESTFEAVYMTRSGTCPNYNTPYAPADVPGSAGKRIDITGKVFLQNSQTSICAMVLANGQYTFSCDGSSNYALNVPLDNNGQFKLQVYADGFAPTIQTFDEFQTMNDVRMARAAECQ